VSLETLSKMLGHKRITTTQTYAKVTQPMIDREVDRRGIGMASDMEYTRQSKRQRIGIN